MPKFAELPRYVDAANRAQMSDPRDQLRDALGRWVDLTEGEWQRLSEIYAPRTMKAGAHVAQPGGETHEMLFVTEGLLRFYYVGKAGAESNKAFVAENDFAGPLVAASRGLPLDYGVQALEPTTLLAAPYLAFRRLVEEDGRTFERLARCMTEHLLAHKEIRTHALLQESARQRYLTFVEVHPEIVQRIPQYHIASYLGITDVHLSRIRRALAEGRVH